MQIFPYLNWASCYLRTQTLFSDSFLLGYKATSLGNRFQACRRNIVLSKSRKPNSQWRGILSHIDSSSATPLWQSQEEEQYLLLCFPNIWTFCIAGKLFNYVLVILAKGQELTLIFFLYTWIRVSWIEFNNCPTRYDLFSLLHFCRQLYMFRVLTPIIRSWYSCNYSFWYWLTGSTGWA